MNQVTFKGEKLAALRVYKRLHQAELAEKTQLSRPTIQRLERGKTANPNMHTVRVLANFFNVPVNAFFSDEAVEIQ